MYTINDDGGGDGAEDAAYSSTADSSTADSSNTSEPAYNSNTSGPEYHNIHAPLPRRCRHWRRWPNSYV